MAIVMNMKWDGVSAAQYDAARAEVKWETNAPTGGIFHVAWFEEGVAAVTAGRARAYNPR